VSIPELIKFRTDGVAFVFVPKDARVWNHNVRRRCRTEASSLIRAILE
jgi:hypothetical protein